MYRGRRE